VADWFHRATLWLWLCPIVRADGVGLENVGILSIEAKDESRHEVIHVRPARHTSPLGIVLKHGDVRPVQAPGGANVERAFAHLSDGRDPGERQEEPEMIGKSS
jgi:hypothetical protein